MGDIVRIRAKAPRDRYRAAGRCLALPVIVTAKGDGHPKREFSGTVSAVAHQPMSSLPAMLVLRLWDGSTIALSLACVVSIERVGA